MTIPYVRGRTRRPLDVCAPATRFERDDYWQSWQAEVAP